MEYVVECVCVRQQNINSKYSRTNEHTHTPNTYLPARARMPLSSQSVSQSTIFGEMLSNFTH